MTPDWEARLIAYLDRRAAEPWGWGRHDCVQFAGGAVEALTGERPTLLRAARYRSAQGAARALRRRGLADVMAAADAALGARLGPLVAGVGWVVAVAAADDGRPALGVMGRGVAWFAASTGGLVGLPPHLLVAAWDPEGAPCPA